MESWLGFQGLGIGFFLVLFLLKVSLKCSSLIILFGILEEKMDYFRDKLFHSSNSFQ